MSMTTSCSEIIWNSPRVSLVGLVLAGIVSLGVGGAFL